MSVVLGIIFLTVSFLFLIFYQIYGDDIGIDDEPFLAFIAVLFFVSGALMLLGIETWLSFLWGILTVAGLLILWWLVVTPIAVITISDYRGLGGVVKKEITLDTPGEIRVTRRDAKIATLIAEIDSSQTRKKRIPKGSGVYIADFDGVVAKVVPYLPLGAIRRSASKRRIPFDIVDNVRKRLHLRKIDKKAIGICRICLLPVFKNEKWKEIPCCNSIAHMDHLKQWLEIKGFCPYCKKRLSWSGKHIIVSMI